MKKILLSAAFLAVSTGAFAADLPSKKSPAVAPVAVAPAFTWTGCYAGLNLGGDWGRSSWSGEIGQNINTHGVSGGVQAGCNYQMSNFVVGVEAEGRLSNLSGSSSLSQIPAQVASPVPVSRATLFQTYSAKSNVGGDIALRAGFAIDRALIFAKAGWAAASYKYAIGYPGLTQYTGSASHNGLLLGAGLEYAFSDHWSAKVEYDYIRYNKKTVSFYNTGKGGLAGTLDIKNTENLIKVGFNYRF